MTKHSDSKPRPETNVEIADPGVAQTLDLDAKTPVVRVRENNPGMFTGPGTNTFLIGSESLWLIDPGEDRDDGHAEALAAAIAGRPVEGILITHQHRDHWPLGSRLAKQWSVPLVGPRQGAKEAATKSAALASLASNTKASTKVEETSAFSALICDRELTHGDWVQGQGFQLVALSTPGHCADHMSFLLLEGDATLDPSSHSFDPASEVLQGRVIFCGDHVMAWSTTILAPPDGSLNDYLASLELLMALDPSVLLPAHGATIPNPRSRMAELRNHRLARTEQLLAALDEEPKTIESLVPLLYRDTDPALYPAAAASLSAHVTALLEEGRIDEHELGYTLASAS